MKKMGVPSCNDVSKLDCGFQAVQGPRKHTRQKYFVTSNFVNGLCALIDTGPSINKQTNKDAGSCGEELVLFAIIAHPALSCQDS